MPPADRRRRLHALDAGPRPPARPGEWSAAGAQFEALVEGLRSELRGATVLRVADAGLAVELYRLRHGRWPESLEELAPDLLPEVPEDPFLPGRLRYRRTGRGAVVYSVGLDAMDDGGRSRHEANKRAGPGSFVLSGFDIAFRLLDVRRRGSPAGSFADEAMGAGLTRRELEVAGLGQDELARLGATEEDLSRLGFDGVHHGAARFAP